jgi:hypothetical protein
MAMGDATDKAVAAAAPPARPRHVGACAGLVDENEPGDVKRTLPLLPARAPRRRRRVPARWRGRFFLKLMPWRSKNRQIELTAAARPRSRNRARTSSSVRSGSLPISLKSHSACASSGDREVPPSGLGITLPVARH